VSVARSAPVRVLSAQGGALFPLALHSTDIVLMQSVIDDVFAALRPPEAPPASAAAQVQAQAQPAAAAVGEEGYGSDESGWGSDYEYDGGGAAGGAAGSSCASWGDLLALPDFLDSLEPHVLSRSQIAPLARLSRAVRDALAAHPRLKYLGLFRTHFGALHGCRLHPHQLRSLRVMHAAEAPAGWEFGAMRGGILADDPGLGKTVTMLALVLSTLGTPPALPPVFWDSRGWPLLRTNPAGLQQLLKLTNFLRRLGFERGWASGPEPAQLRRLAAFANRQGAPGDYPTIEAFETDVEAVVRVAVERRGGARASIEQVRAVREPVRLHLLAVREGLDPRQRGFNKTALGKRVQMERRLIGTSATLIIVPSSLLEHWHEQLCRHVDPAVLQLRRGDDGSPSCCEVWIDGLGDWQAAGGFRLPSKPKVEAWPPLPDEYLLGACSIVVTTYERCQSLSSTFPGAFP